MEDERGVRLDGAPGRGEKVPEERERRVSRVKLRAVPDAERKGYLHQWAVVQRQFVNDPRGAVNEADRLVTDVMAARGCPMSEFMQRADDISVDYPHMVGNYRAAHEVVVRNGKGQSSTEDLRRAMVHFHSLFDELLGVTGGAHREVA